MTALSRYINTDDFVQEVHKRECIWYKKDPEHYNVLARRNAWEQIAEACYPGWADAKSKEKDKIVSEISKKWRHIRDYYKKETRKVAENKGTKKVMKTSYFPYLSFLDNPTSSRSQTSNDNDNPSDNESMSSCNENHEQDHLEEIAIEVKHEIPFTNLLKNTPTTASKPAQKRFRPTQETESHSNATKSFLMSLIPDVETLNEQQYMNFRIGVLNLLNNIKYPTLDNESWLISTIGNGNN